MNTFKNKIAHIHKEMSESLQAHKKLFVNCNAPALSKELSNNNTAAYFEISQAPLHNHFGYIDVRVAYVSNDNEPENTDYNFKFFSNIDKILIEVEREIKPARDYGFRFDKNIYPKAPGHPISHLQFEFSRSPRFTQQFENEVAAFDDFLKTIHDSFFTTEISPRSIFLTH